MWIASNFLASPGEAMVLGSSTCSWCYHLVLPQFVMYLQNCYGPLLRSGEVQACITAILLYIDDGIVASKSKETRIQRREIVVSNLKKAGFVLNLPKSYLDPQQIGKWLVFIIDICKGSYYVPEDKLGNLKPAIKRVYHLSRIPVKALAILVGFCLS